MTPRPVKRKGMDPSDAAYRADQAELRAGRKLSVFTLTAGRRAAKRRVK